jgi:hypothetical protein
MTVPRFYGERPPGIDSVDLPGRLVVIEGTDGVGRTSRCSRSGWKRAAMPSSIQACAGRS